LIFNKSQFIWTKFSINFSFHWKNQSIAIHSKIRSFKITSKLIFRISLLFYWNNFSIYSIKHSFNDNYLTSFISSSLVWNQPN
jgi:hypothetical protein